MARDSGSASGSGSKRGPGGSASRAGGGRPPGTPSRRHRRSGGKAGAVKKPFPTGFVAGCVAIVLVLGGILAYSATHVGSAFTSALDKADDQFTGLQVNNGLSAVHTWNKVAYPDRATVPPDGGNHSFVWYTCAVYTEPVITESAVHSLEHGAVWITYRPDLPADQVTVLSGLATGNSYVLMSPYPDLEAPVTVQAWGRRIVAQNASDPQIAKFVSTYANGPQNREVGAGCSGAVTQPGTVPLIEASDGSLVPNTNAIEVPAKGNIPNGGGASPGSSATPDPAVAPTTPAPTTPAAATTGAPTTP